MSHVNLFDISHWNSTADFAQAKAAGYVGVYLKATQGAGYTDPTFAPRAAAAKAAGLHVGAYLFFDPKADVAAQVHRFVAVTRGVCDLDAALDHETASGNPAHDAAAALQALQLLKAAGLNPILYTYRAFISDGEAAGLGAYPLWIADYSGGTAPTIPGVWNSWVMWQTGQAKVAGIAAGDGSGVDVDIAPSLDALLIHRPSPAPSGDSPLLKLGSKGPKVKDVQHALNLCGNDIPVDGVFGALTDKILRVFQDHRGIKVTGTTDAKTWAALRLVAHPNK